MKATEFSAFYAPHISPHIRALLVPCQHQGLFPNKLAAFGSSLQAQAGLIFSCSFWEMPAMFAPACCYSLQAARLVK